MLGGCVPRLAGGQRVVVGSSPAAAVGGREGEEAADAGEAQPVAKMMSVLLLVVGISEILTYFAVHSPHQHSMAFGEWFYRALPCSGCCHCDGRSVGVAVGGVVDVVSPGAGVVSSPVFESGVSGHAGRRKEAKVATARMILKKKMQKIIIKTLNDCFPFDHYQAPPSVIAGGFPHLPSAVRPSSSSSSSSSQSRPSPSPHHDSPHSAAPAATEAASGGAAEGTAHAALKKKKMDKFEP